MEKQETKWKLKMETGNGNGKWKLETQMEQKNAPITGVFIVCLVITLLFYYRTVPEKRGNQEALILQTTATHKHFDLDRSTTGIRAMGK